MVTGLALMVLTPAGRAEAASSLVTASVSCSFDALPPVMNAKKQISGSVTLTCRNLSKSLQYVTARVAIYEYDSMWGGDRYEYNFMGNAYAASKIFSIKAGASGTFTLATGYTACINVGEAREDYGTLATIANGSATATDRDQRTDYYVC